SANAALRFEVTATHKGVVNLLPSISVSGLPQFPPLDLHWPKIDWKDLQWPSITLPDLSKLLQLHLPAPGIGDPLSIVWLPKPNIVVQFAGGRLSIATLATGNGTPNYTDGGGTQVIATITGFGLTLSPAGSPAGTF